MFTGIIETVGTIAELSKTGASARLVVESRDPFASPLENGESIAVNGVCLSLEKSLRQKILTFHALEETLSKTSFLSLETGASVNLERALKLGDRLGGHLLSGHVDGTAHSLGMKKKGGDWELKVEIPGGLSRYMVQKGSIAIDGVSLTIVSISEKDFTVHLIPETLKRTALSGKAKGDLLNIETDMLAKYVEKLLSCREDLGIKSTAKSVKKKWDSKISMETLSGAGWF